MNETLNQQSGPVMEAETLITPQQLPEQIKLESLNAG